MSNFGFQGCTAYDFGPSESELSDAELRELLTEGDSGCSGYDFGGRNEGVHPAVAGGGGAHPAVAGGRGVHPALWGATDVATTHPLDRASWQPSGGGFELPFMNLFD